MEFRYTRAVTVASLYGHQKLDVKKGSSFVKEIMESAWNEMPYFSKSSGKKRRMDRGIALFNELKRRLSKDDILAEYARISENKTEKPPVLGGDTPARQLKRISPQDAKPRR